MTEAVTYTQQELEDLRLAISGTRGSDKAKDSGSSDDGHTTGQLPAYLLLFQEVVAAKPKLYQKLLLDPLLKTYSMYGFFPAIYDLLYLENRSVGITFSGRTRGRVAILRFEDRGLVVKPTQSDREAEIANVAGELGVGPRQYPSLPGFITEELLTGRFFTELSEEEVSEDAMFALGKELGRILSRLHSEGIYYNDATLSDPSGRSHLIVNPDGSCRLIDFGVSLLLDQHPSFTREEVYNFVRTLPMYRVFAGMGIRGEQLDEFLEEYKLRLANASKKEIMSRDIQFIEEGLSMASKRMGGQIVQPFFNGFRQSYGV